MQSAPTARTRVDSSADATAPGYRDRLVKFRALTESEVAARRASRTTMYASPGALAHIGVDAGALFVAFELALLARFRFETAAINIRWYWISIGIIVLLDLTWLYASGLYETRDVALAKRVRTVVDGFVYSTFAYLVFAYFIKETLFSRLTLLYFIFGGLALQLLHQAALMRYRMRAYAAGRGLNRALLIGNLSESAAQVLRSKTKLVEIGLELLGRLGDETNPGASLVPVLGMPEQYEDILEETRVGAVVLISDVPGTDHLIEHCLSNYISVYAVAGGLDLLRYPTEVVFAGDIPLVKVRDLLIFGLGGKLKRIVDVALSTAALVALSPLMTLVALAVKLTSRGPVFFSHNRLGIGGRVIRVRKFRTMYADAEARLHEMLRDDDAARDEFEATFKLRNDPRITPLGKFLRRTSLDELPQFLNVLMGDMSLVGPRPIVENEMQKYGDAAKFILRVPPGVSGMWQISGRSDISYAQRVQLDMHYITQWNIWLDLQIMLRTIPAVLGQRGSC